MALASVNISFEATDSDEAKSLIDTWILHPGCVVSASVTEIGAHSITNEDGAVVPAPEEGE